MKNNHTDITIVLDRSGSMGRMGSVAADTIGGFNQFLDDQKKVPGTATITLNQFDDKYERVIDAQDIQTAHNLTKETFVPRGMTALLDGIGKSISDTGTRLSAIDESNRPSKVVMVIITDGGENSSKEYTKTQINKMIQEQRDKYSWEFVFLGANQDAIATAESFSIPKGNAMTYAHNSAGTISAFASTSRNLQSVRMCHSQSMAYTDADRKEQEAAGA